MKEELSQHHNELDEANLVGLSEYSYERIFNVYKDNDKYAYNILRTVHIPMDLNPETFVYTRVTGNLTWTQISFHEYRTIRLWWLICATNKILNPVSLPKPGMVIKIIKPQYVRDVVEQIKVQLNES